MGRRNQHLTAGLSSGLTASEEKELAELEQWCKDKEHKQGITGGTVWHERRDALRQKKAGVIPPAAMSQEAKDDDADS